MADIGVKSVGVAREHEITAGQRVMQGEGQYDRGNPDEKSSAFFPAQWSAFPKNKPEDDNGKGKHIAAHQRAEAKGYSAPEKLPEILRLKRVITDMQK